MAVRIPDPLKRRHLVEKEEDPAKCLALAEAYLETGRVIEALLFLQRADAQDRLDEVFEQGISEGDVFLVRETARIRGTEVDGRVWRRVAEAATRLGKARYAEDATRFADRLSP